MEPNSSKNIINQIENHWHKSYWFARMLISNDKYGGIGNDNKLLSTISSTLRLIQKEDDTSDLKTILETQKQSIRNILLKRYSKAKTRLPRIERLCDDLDKDIHNLKDMEVFILTCEHIMLPINQAIQNVPNDDKEFTLAIAKSYLDIQGEKGLATVVNLWDDLGTKGCLTAERTEIVKAFTTLRVLLENKSELDQEGADIILTAFTQEFERRVAQKRKGRAGGSLEDVTSFILRYFNIESTSKPEHFQADIEIDKWVGTKDKWLIGISCKRTLRERWKQVSSAESSILSKFRIKYIYHILTFDEDLSDDKITQLGSNRHYFYLPDRSRRLEYAREHIGLKDYVRPISKLIIDLKAEI